MLKIFFAVGTALTLLFGAVGVGAAVAQNSQPGELSYALKAWGEPFQFMFQTREQVQTQTMDGLTQSGQQAQNQIRMQTQEMFQAQQMNDQAESASGQQDRDQTRLQTQDRLQICETLDPSAITSISQDCDQTQDQIQLQTQDRLHTQDKLQDPQGSAMQNQNGGPHKP